MKQNMTDERIAGGLLLLTLVFGLIASAISGYDTGAPGFDSELRRLADLNRWQDNMNAAFRGIAGLGLIGAAAGFYVCLRERSSTLAAIAGFGLIGAGVLTSVAGALQLVFVDLAEEYVASSGAHRDQVLVTARAVALAVEGTAGAAMLTLLTGIAALAVLIARERLAPRWLAALPAAGFGLVCAAFIVEALDDGDGAWLFLMAGMLAMLLWLIVTGCWLLLASHDRARPVASREGLRGAAL